MSSVPAVVLAAVSGTAFIVLALKLHSSLSLPPSPPRPCISSGAKKGKKKKVRFAKDVVDPSGDSEEFRKRLNIQIQKKNSAALAAVKVGSGGMPANRAALYNGILRDRLVHRMGYSY